MTPEDKLKEATGFEIIKAIKGSYAFIALCWKELRSRHGDKFCDALRMEIEPK